MWSSVCPHICLAPSSFVLLQAIQRRRQQYTYFGTLQSLIFHCCNGPIQDTHHNEKKYWTLMFPSCSHQASRVVPTNTRRVSPNWSALEIVAKKHHIACHFFCRIFYPCQPTLLNPKRKGYVHKLIVWVCPQCDNFFGDEPIKETHQRRPRAKKVVMSTLAIRNLNFRCRTTNQHEWHKLLTKFCSRIMCKCGGYMAALYVLDNILFWCKRRGQK